MDVSVGRLYVQTLELKHHSGKQSPRDKRRGTLRLRSEGLAQQFSRGSEAGFCMRPK